jgi:hypothetical protein
VDINNVAVILFVAFSVLVLQNAGMSMIAVAVGLSMFMQRTGTGLHRPPTALNLDGPRSDGPLVALSKPPIPGGWSALVQLSRPRKVFMPTGSKAWLLLGIGFFSLFEVGPILSFLRRASWSDVRALVHNSGDSLNGIVWLAFCAYFCVLTIRAWLVNREVLRDGELTTGLLTHYDESRAGIYVRYQFWTDSGQRFERRGRVFTKKELAVATAPLKVFYLPQDP